MDKPARLKRRRGAASASESKAATPASAPWVASLLQLSDSFYPTGAYAHSFGLEGLVQEGAVRDRATLRTFLLGQALPQLARTDLPIAAHAFAAAGEPADWARLRNLCFLGNAIRGAREPREASDAIGRQRLQLAVMLHGGFALEFDRRSEGWPRPLSVIAAIEGRTLRLPLDAVLAIPIYSAAAGLIAASVKLLRIGQNASQTLLAEAMGRAPALMAEAVAVPYDKIGSFNPWWDIAAARHETADFRLFIS
jgi:urease accessory protein